MRINNINGELRRIEELHEESNFNYRLPDFTGEKKPLFPIQRAISKNGNLLCASIVKVEAEVYLFMDHENGTPEERWEALKELHADVVFQAKQIGFDQLYCVIPPELVKSFGPRLEELGWVESRPWPKYTLELL